MTIDMRIIIVIIIIKNTMDACFGLDSSMNIIVNVLLGVVDSISSVTQGSFNATDFNALINVPVFYAIITGNNILMTFNISRFLRNGGAFFIDIYDSFPNLLVYNILFNIIVAVTVVGSGISFGFRFIVSFFPTSLSFSLILLLFPRVLVRLL